MSARSAVSPRKKWLSGESHTNTANKYKETEFLGQIKRPKDSVSFLMPKSKKQTITICYIY